jgi:hypothetical protein
VSGLLLCAEHYAAPYDLLAAALDPRPARLRVITARQRAAGYAATGTVGPGPARCCLTPAGMIATGRPLPARLPALARLAYIRAVLAARLWLQAAPAYAEAGVWWRSERCVRAALPTHVGAAHVADAEIHWPGRPDQNQMTIWVTITDATPLAIQQLLDDPRTGSDTCHPAETTHTPAPQAPPRFWHPRTTRSLVVDVTSATFRGAV